MANPPKKCDICKQEFYSTNVFESTCPECKRTGAYTKQLYENQKKLQESNQSHERRIRHEENELQNRLHTEKIQNENELFEKRQQLEEHKLNEHRRIQEDHLSQAEIISIKDKVYNLALSKSVDTDNISKLIKLLLTQHESHNEFIYRNIIALGSPFDACIKQVLCDQIKERINTVYKDLNLTFQQKACKYFMPDFSGYEYEVFAEFLEDESSFQSAIKHEINVCVKKGETYNHEKIIHNQADENINGQISYDISKYESLEKRVGLLGKIFGENYSFFPRLNWFLAIAYTASIFFLSNKFSLVTALAILAFGYVASFLIVAMKNNMENRRKILLQELKENESKLEEINEAIDQIEENEVNNNSFIEQLKKSVSY